MGARETLQKIRTPLLSSVRTSRDESVVGAVVRLAPPHSHEMLDIGCSEGRVASAISATLGVSVQGVDVQVHDDAMLDVALYDGTTLPFDGSSFDVVTILDVLHHADDPAAVLREALRVVRPTGRVVIKDHVRKGPWGNFILGRMDVFGNWAIHERVVGRYLSLREWGDLFSQVGAQVETLETPFRVHGLPWRLVARDAYHLMAVLRPA